MDSPRRPGPTPIGPPASSRLNSWKEIAAYLDTSVRTVQRWERSEGLPVHRHEHAGAGTVYAYRSEVDIWLESRRPVLDAESPKLKPCRHRVILAGVAVALIIAAALGFRLLRKPGLPALELKLVPLTSYPGNEASPSFSPDGSQVAFAWKREGREDFDIYVKVVGSDKPLQLTGTPDWDLGPAWSPDGREIAFYRIQAGGKHGIYVVSPLGGTERLVTDLGEMGYTSWWPNPNSAFSLLSWSPDGKWLAYRGIWLLSVATGERRRLTSPPPMWLWDVSPAFSPDGQSLAFVRRKSAYVDDVYIASVAGGEPRRLTTDERQIFGLCWTADGREIVFSSNRAGEQGLWRVPVSGGAPRHLAEAGEHAWFPSISRHGNRLALTRQLIDVNIWQVEAPATHGATRKPARLISSTREDTAPQFSPDGKRIGFTSDRSGTMQVWVSDRDGSNPVQLTSFPAPGAELSSWSPDGRSIAFNSMVRGNWDIYVIAAQGGTPRQLTAETSEEVRPSWSRNGRWVYFGSNRTGRFEVWKVPAEGGPAVQVTKNGGYRPVESRDGQFVYYNKAQLNFDAWKAPVGGGEETAVLKNLRSRWALAQDGLYLFEQEQGGTWFLKFFDFSTGRKQPVAPLPGTPVVGQAPTVSPDGRIFLYAQWDLGEADLMLVENFH